jgi:NAD(P)H-flavin reductase
MTAGSSKSFLGRVVERHALSESVEEIWLEREDQSPFSFTPGQHVLLTTGDEGEPSAQQSGAFSLAQPPGGAGRFAICLRGRQPGDCASTLATLPTGALVRCEGPHGSLVLEEPVGSDLLLVATGTGIAPFHAMLGQLRRVDVQHTVWLLQGARHRSELLYADDWRDLARSRSSFRYLPVLSQPQPADDWRGPVGRVGDLLDELPRLTARPLRAYLCGWPEMVAGMTKELVRRGLGREAIRREL